MRRITHSLGVALLFLRALLAHQTTFAGDFQSSANSAPRTDSAIVVSNCRIKLVDEIVLGSQRFGVIDWVVPEGTHLKQNELAIVLDDRAARTTVAIVEEQAQNDVEVRYARKASQLAQIAYLRSTSLNQKLPGSVTDFSLREQRLAAEKALLQLEQAQHNFAIAQLKLQEAQQNLAMFQVRAPFDGFVRKVHKKPGETAHEGEPVAELVDTARVVVEGFVKLDEVDRIALGNAVEVSLDSAGARPSGYVAAFRGCVAFVDVKVEPITRKVRIAAEVTNHDNRLRDGLPAQMMIFTGVQRTPMTQLGPVHAVAPNAE
jgi:multidrug efflux pump subunit AcrA (membrane-fusion protein)